VDLLRNLAEGDDGGGIVSWTDSIIELTQGVTIAENAAADEGGGLWLYGGSSLLLEDNVTLASNSAGSDGGCLMLGSQSVVVAHRGIMISRLVRHVLPKESAEWQTPL